MANMHEIDAELYRKIHELTYGPTASEPADRRSNSRRGYPGFQLVAPYNGQQLPELADFQETRCVDISGLGASLLTPAPIESPLVLALGPADSRIFLAAEVVHSTPMTLLGCRFIKRVHY